MNYGFLIDNRKCIGCHACSIACKSENEVPLGVNRTWVKYTEKGVFPDTRRYFQVTRCNHCANPPCVRICPTTAMYQRPDGIVEFDPARCIGCKACMQACPYDAIYLNEDLGAVEKCHYCAHKVEVGLEPACVVVCPEKAIVSGDLDDPKSRISLMVLQNQTLVRRPEQRTGPNVHYKGVEAALLNPGEASRPSTYIWSDRPPHKPEPWPAELHTLPDTRVVLDAGHRVEWGWPVALYLVTKGIAGGAGMLAPFAAVLGLTGWAGRYLPETLAIVFTLVTTFLLVEDLKRPLLFYRLLTRPNWRSWLVKGGIVLGLFGASSAGAILLHMLGADGAAAGLRWVEAFLGLGAAGYTAFLFAQCEGRDLWQSRWLLPHLVAQALLCGSAALAPASADRTALAWVFGVSTLAHVLIACLERYGRHHTANATQAAAFLGIVRLQGVPAWRAGIFLGVLAAGTLGGGYALPPLTLAIALYALFLYEYAYVRAAQLPPLS